MKTHYRSRYTNLLCKLKKPRRGDKRVKKNELFVVIIPFFLSACGGGGGSQSINNNGESDLGDNDNQQIVSESGEGVQLFIGDALGTGATYRVENFSHSFDDMQTNSISVTETVAIPGSQIDIIWWTNAKDSEDQVVMSYQYNAEVFLSNDEVLDPADQSLFSLGCDAPMSTNDPNPCSGQGYVRCEYADSNNPTLTCLTIPPMSSDGFSDLVIDISSYFSIGNPTLVNFITKLCLPGQETDCITETSKMTLY